MVVDRHEMSRARQLEVGKSFHIPARHSAHASKGTMRVQFLLGAQKKQRA